MKNNKKYTITQSYIINLMKVASCNKADLNKFLKTKNSK